MPPESPRFPKPSVRLSAANRAATVDSPRSRDRSIHRPAAKASKQGFVAFSSLDIPHAWDPKHVYPTKYQADYLKFAPKAMTRLEEFKAELKEELARKGPYEMENLDVLRDLYAELVQERGKLTIETGLLRQLCSKICRVFTLLVKGCIKNGDKKLLQLLIEEVENDPLLLQIVKPSYSLSDLKERIAPDVGKTAVARHRNALDDQLNDGSSAKRASGAALMVALNKDRLEGFEKVTFNPETGRANFLTELKFRKDQSLYHNPAPIQVDFEDDVLAEDVLREIVKLYNHFQVRLDVVQVHKVPYRTKDDAEEAEHEEWMINLAKARAKKLRNTLEMLGIPKDMMSAKVETVDRTVVMQYCSFKLDWQHINVDSRRMFVIPKSEIVFEKRVWAKSFCDDPEADLSELVLVKAMFREVAVLAKFYNSYVQIVIHNNIVAKDDEHEEWADELVRNRAELLKEVSSECGLDGERVDTRVIGEAEHDTVTMCRAACMGCHIEFLKEQGSPGIFPSAKPQDHHLEVSRCSMAEFNGIYLPAGQQYGQIKYRHETLDKPCIAFGEGLCWHMCYNYNISQSFYRSRDLSGPSSSWRSLTKESAGSMPQVEYVSGAASRQPSMSEVASSNTVRPRSTYRRRMRSTAMINRTNIRTAALSANNGAEGTPQRSSTMEAH